MAPREDETTTSSVTPIRQETTDADVPPADACLVIIYGPDLGRRIELGQASFEIGRASKCDLPLDQEGVSRHHACISRENDGCVLRDLGSTNGTYVNDRAIRERKLADGDQIKIGRSILKFMTGGNIEATYHEEIYRLMTVDGLTRLFNRRYFNDALEREINRSKRYDHALSLALFDIDFFKKTNDTFGHVAGDALLRQLADATLGKLRREDILARVGGEEFAVILPEIDLAGARVTGEKLRQIVQETAFTFDELTLQATISVGVAQWHGAGEPSRDLYERADAALYRAKNGGRNRVE